MKKPRPPKRAKPPTDTTGPTRLADGNARLGAQIRKVLGKHYANRYGRVRG